ncbi:hypothetical protein GJ744_009493 [Endocarpon pusillum]|uniref:Uncharacterized protein n=1 Tax=Endocarpon pusillum TaxID=364733 RepID=A0A8H7E644_9EURO|nr:hypothetical protein GJ744_009493 [Endocarpon pusillum]
MEPVMNENDLISRTRSDTYLIFRHATEPIFVILMLANEEHRGEFLAPVGIGSGLFLVEPKGIYYTRSSTNPPRSCGPCVVVHDDKGHHWTSWVGLLLKALVTTGFYLSAFNDETLDPVRPLESWKKFRADEFDSPGRSKQRAPSYDEDEYKRTEAANQGTSSGVVNEKRDHAVDGVYRTITNGVMRSQRYAGDPGIEAGAAIKVSLHISTRLLATSLCFNAKLDAGCWMLPRSASVLVQGGSSALPVPRTQYPCLV